MAQTHGVLSGHEIEKQLKEGRIAIDPFSPNFVNPASYDLTLGEEVKVYDGPTTYVAQGSAQASAFAKMFPQFVVDMSDPNRIRPLDRMEEALNKTVLDSRSPNLTHSFQIGPEGLVLNPGVGYLMHTKERVSTNHFVPVIDGKSSLGRLFIQVHVTAGYGDPGFDGQFTLEVVVTHPVRVYAGMRFCQVRFHTIAGEPRLYKGHYREATAVGAVASRSWEQYKEEHDSK